MIAGLLWISAALWALILLQFLVNRSVIRPLPKPGPGQPKELPFVSIVSPARNEERGIREAVSSFCRQDYPRLEVIVVDDGSTDATPRILKELQAEFPRLKVVPCQNPPKGWLGKPNALETGRKTAKGNWLIFSDADVVYAPDVVSRSVAFALRGDASMVCLWPDILTGGILEAAILFKLVFCFALAPVYLVPRARFKHAAVGNGVFNMVRRDALEACGAFECLKDAVVDDIGLGFKVKGAGFGQAMALAGDLIRIRMYYGFRETLTGFNKNIYHLFRKTPWMFVLMPPIFILMWLPYICFFGGLVHGMVSLPALAALGFMHVVAGCCVALFRMPWYVTFLIPVTEVLWTWILVRSFWSYHRRGIVWRGRTFEP